METLSLFDTVFLLSHRKLCYAGPVPTISHYLETVDHPVPAHLTAAEYAINFVKTDYASNRAEEEKKLARLTDLWSPQSQKISGVAKPFHIFRSRCPSSEFRFAWKAISALCCCDHFPPHMGQM